MRGRSDSLYVLCLNRSNFVSFVRQSTDGKNIPSRTKCAAKKVPVFLEICKSL